MGSGAAMHPSTSSLVPLPGMVPRQKDRRPGAGPVEGMSRCSSCTNPVHAGSKLCRSCGRIVDVLCTLCGVTLIPVPASQTKHQYVCRPCHIRKLGLSATQPQRQGQPAHGATQRIQSLKSLVPLRPAPPAYPGPPPRNVPAMPPTVASIIPYARQYVHRDHQALFDTRDLSIPPTPSALPSVAELTAAQDARRKALNRLPHYGPRGEILALISVDMAKKLAPRPPVVATPVALALPQSKPTPSASVNAPAVTEAPVERKPVSSVACPQAAPSQQQTPPTTPSEIDAKVAAPRKFAPLPASPLSNNATPPQGTSQSNSTPHKSQLAAPAESSDDIIPELVPPPRKKRKRAPPVPAPATRSCANPECSRAIPVQFQGTFCVDCGFDRWRGQLRTRIAKFRADLTKETEIATSDKDSETLATPTNADSVSREDVPMDVSEPDNVPQPHSSVTEVKVEPETPSQRTVGTSEPTDDHTSTPKSLAGPLARDADAMDVDSSDDEPLASAVLSPLTSLDEPLTAMAHATSSDDEPLSAINNLKDHDQSSDDEPLAGMQLSSDEEPLSGFMPSYARTETVDESISRLDTQTKMTGFNRLRIQIPPALKPPSQTIRRVRLILGPKPATPQPSSPSSSSRESSPERSSSSPRRRYSGWFSDESELTPLESSMDEGESEAERQESAHDTSAPTVTAGKRTTSSRRKKGSRPVKHRLQCATDDCANLLPRDWKWRFCNTCRSQHRIFHREQALLQRLDQGNTHGLATLPGADLTGHRKCSSHSCKRLVPPIEQYQYKRCPRCRENARRHRHVQRHGVTFDQLSQDPGSSLSSARASAFVTSDSMMLHSSKSRPPGPTGFAHTDGKLVDLPPFQHFPALLHAFRARFDTFRAAQARYVQLKALQGAERQPMVFTFDGEYSIVANPAGGAVDPIVNTAIGGITSALGLVFVPVGVLSGPEDSIIAELKCVYAAQISALRGKTATAEAVDESEVGAQQPSASPTTQAPGEIAMAGELQICVAWDRRHRLFAGQKIMLRFRLVG